MVKRKSDNIFMSKKLKYRKTDVLPNFTKPNNTFSTAKKRKSRVNKSIIDSKLIKRNDFNIDDVKTEIYSFGEGDAGQLGLGDDILTASFPKIIEKLSQNNHDLITRICAGGMHSICLSSNNKLFSFGCNDDGALGRLCINDEMEKIPLEIIIPDNCTFLDIAAGDSFTSVLANDGVVFSWGVFRDDNGIMGLITNKIEKTPMKIYENKVKPIIKISCGNNHLLLLTELGEVLSLGSSEQGQLGRISSRSCKKDQRKGLNLFLQPSPVHFPLQKGKLFCAKAIFATSYSSFAIDQFTNKIYAWGLNNFGQLGYLSKKDDTTKEFFPVEVKWDIKNEVTQISGGPHHTLILDSKGIVYAVGRKEYGRLGLGDLNIDIYLPTPIPFFKNIPSINQISAGECVSYALNNNGECYSWGMCSTSQLANGNKDEDALIPMKIKGKQIEGKRIASISAGGQHTLLLAHSI